MTVSLYFVVSSLFFILLVSDDGDEDLKDKQTKLRLV